MKVLKIIGIIIIAITVFLFLLFEYNEYKAKETGKIKYPEAIELLQQGEYDAASTKIFMYKKFNKKYDILYNYANAKEKIHKNDYSMAYYYVKDIDPSIVKDEFYYDDLVSIQNKLREEDEKKQKAREKEFEDRMAARERQRDQEAIERAQRYEERKHRIYIGDPEDKITEIFGTPDSVNRHVSAYGTTKQYVYYRGDKMICIYTEDGIITDFQD